MTSFRARVSSARRALVRCCLYLRGLPDRLLHGVRHRAALRRLRRRERPRSILVVCQGNICRSPYLAAVLQRELRDVEVRSAGFIGPGRPVPTAALHAGAQRGQNLADFRSRLITSDEVRSADLVITMDAAQAARLRRDLLLAPDRLVVAGDLDRHPAPTRAIRDPWSQRPEVFDATFERLERCARTLTQNLAPPS